MRARPLPTDTGVGTNMTNDFKRASDGQVSKPLNMVIKLNSINGHPTIKISDDLTKNTGDAEEVAYVAIQMFLRQHGQAPLWPRRVRAH